MMIRCAIRIQSEDSTSERSGSESLGGKKCCGRSEEAMESLAIPVLLLVGRFPI